MYYRIQSNVPGGPFYLSINNNDPTGGLIINNDFNNDSQLWQPIAVVANNDTYQGIALLNKKSGLVAFAPGDGLQVQQVSPNSMQGSSATWNIVGSAIQLHTNTKMNLNVSGKGPYQSGNIVLNYGWKDGQPNETWQWVPVDFKP